MDKITKNQNYWSGMLIFSKHTEASQNWKPGLRLTTTNKIKYCERFKYMAAINKVLPNEFRTVHELGSFGKAKNGSYRSQSGNDDLAMTCVNVSAFFDSPNFWEIANDEIDRLSKERLAQIHDKYLSDLYFNGKSTRYDYATLTELNNNAGLARRAGLNLNMVDDYTRNHNDLTNKFYGGDPDELQRYKEEMEKYRNQ